MRIFARMGVMKNNENQITFKHFVHIIGQIYFFSSKNPIKKISGGAQQSSDTQTTKEKNSLVF